MKDWLLGIGKRKINQYREGGLGGMITGKRDILKLAVIGTGNHCRNNLLPNLPFLPVKVVSVCSAHIENAEFYGEKYGALNYYDDYVKMVEKDEVDLIICSVSAEEHPKVINQISKRNIPLFVEKPPAKTLNELEELRSNERNNKVMVGFQKRFVPNYQFIKDSISSKKYGHLNYLQLEFGVGAFSSSMEEFLLEIGIHFVDLLRFFVPDVKISEVKKSKAESGRMNISVSFSSEQDILGHLLLSSNFDWSNCHERVFANFKKINVVVDNLVGIKISSNSKTVMNIPLEKVTRKKIFKKQWYPNYISGISENSSLAQTGFLYELDYFVNSVAKKGVNEVSNLNSAYETYLLLEEINRV
jgi:myo-inositol 2-dehydrogenase/D-chiro-inositol 1-dehydrogenase